MQLDTDQCEYFEHVTPHALVECDMNYINYSVFAAPANLKYS